MSALVEGFEGSRYSGLGFDGLLFVRPGHCLVACPSWKLLVADPVKLFCGSWCVIMQQMYPMGARRTAHVWQEYPEKGLVGSLEIPDLPSLTGLNP